MHRTSQFQAILRAFEAKDRNILEGRFSNSYSDSTDSIQWNRSKSDNQ